jgi:hypothetical protein
VLDDGQIQVREPSAALCRGPMVAVAA